MLRYVLLLAASSLLPLTAQAARLPGVYVNSIGMSFVTIPAGSFEMGSPDQGSDEKPVHTVTISKAFMLGRTEVTQAQWQAVMGNNPAVFKGDDRPVENVSWDDAQVFIGKLNEQEGCTCYRLPTEAEWEYVAKTGGSNLEMAWHAANAPSSTQPVAYKAADRHGAYDLLGNVREWTADWYDRGYYYAKSPAADPQGPSKGGDRFPTRVFRGGGCFDSAQDVRPGLRSGYTPGHRGGLVGFRLLRISS